MNVAQIIQLFRTEVFDLNEPYLFPDATCAMWLTEAHEEAAIRAKLIHESESPLLTRFELREGVRSYPLDSRMLMVEAASIRYKGAHVLDSWQIAVTTERDMARRDRFWRVTSNEPTAIIQYDTKLGMNCVPNAKYVVEVRGYRLPMSPLAVVAVPETLASSTITLASGSSGSVTTLTVGGVSVIDNAVAYNTSLSQTAADLAAEINSSTGMFTATAAGNVVTLRGITGSGMLHNGTAVAASATGITVTTTALSGGVDAVANVPEIAAVHHRHLVKWMVYRAFDRLDAETFDRNRAMVAYAEFEAMFGRRPDANYLKNVNANHSHVNRGYP
jgi:hypothetical protein